MAESDFRTAGEIAKLILEDGIDSDWRFKHQRMQAVMSAVYSEQMLEIIPQIACIIQLWDEVEKTENKFIFNDLDAYIQVHASEDGTRLLISCENASILFSEQVISLFYIEGTRDLRDGDFSVEDLSRAAIFRGFDECDRTEEYSAPDGKLGREPSIADYHAKIDRGSLPMNGQDAMIFDMNLESMSLQMNMVDSTSWGEDPAQRKLADKMRRDIRIDFADKFCRCYGTPEQVRLAMTWPSHALMAMEQEIGIDRDQPWDAAAP